MSIPDHVSRVQLSGNAKAAACRGRLLVSDLKHVGLKLQKDRHVQLLCCGSIYSAAEEGRQGESNFPDVTQDHIHAGKIDDGTRRKAGMMKIFTATNPYQCIRDVCATTLRVCVCVCFLIPCAIKVGKPLKSFHLSPNDKFSISAKKCMFYVKVKSPNYNLIRFKIICITKDNRPHLLTAPCHRLVQYHILLFRHRCTFPCYFYRFS